MQGFSCGIESHFIYHSTFYQNLNEIVINGKRMLSLFHNKLSFVTLVDVTENANRVTAFGVNDLYPYGRI
jgi:hypothetical protein